jgi:hypothetical protein
MSRMDGLSLRWKGVPGIVEIGIPLKRPSFCFGSSVEERTKRIAAIRMNGNGKYETYPRLDSMVSATTFKI